MSRQPFGDRHGGDAPADLDQRRPAEDEQNVTIIYAENGVGKTTLLNALLWCFYGETTKRFEKKEDIVNHDARKAGRITASVEVFFSHNGAEYVAKRFAGSGPIVSGARLRSSA